MKTAAKDEAYRVANMTPDMRMQFQNRLSDVEKEATMWRLADVDHVTLQLKREIFAITSIEQKWFKMEISIRVIEFEAWWGTIGIPALRKTIQQPVIHFGYPKMQFVSHRPGSIRRMGSSDNITTEISERLHMANVNEAYQSGNKVNYIPQMLKHNDRCTGLDYMEETLSYLTLQGRYEVDFVKVFNL